MSKNAEKSSFGVKKTLFFSSLRVSCFEESPLEKIQKTSILAFGANNSLSCQNGFFPRFSSLCPIQSSYISTMYTQDLFKFGTRSLMEYLICKTSTSLYKVYSSLFMGGLIDHSHKDSTHGVWANIQSKVPVAENSK